MIATLLLSLFACCPHMSPEEWRVMEGAEDCYIGHPCLIAAHDITADRNIQVTIARYTADHTHREALNSSFLPHDNRIAKELERLNCTTRRCSLMATLDVSLTERAGKVYTIMNAEGQTSVFRQPQKDPLRLVHEK